MGYELEKSNHAFKVNLQECVMTNELNQRIKSVTGVIFSFNLKSWDDGNVTATLGVADDENNFWIRYNPNTWFGVRFHSKLLNIYGKPNVRLEFYTTKDLMTDIKYFNASVKQKDVEIKSKYEKPNLNDSARLIEEMLYKFGKSGQPKADEEVEQEYKEMPEPATLNTGVIPQLNDENVAVTDDVPF